MAEDLKQTIKRCVTSLMKDFNDDGHPESVSQFTTQKTE